MKDKDNLNWSAADFFRKLTETNKMAVEAGAVFCRVSGLQGYQDAIAGLKKRKPVVAVSDVSKGTLFTDNTPHYDRLKMVFFAWPHAVDSMEDRQKAMEKIRELFRQFMTVFIREKVRLEESNIYLDQQISLNEIDKYIFSGMAAAYCHIQITTYTNLEFDESEWIETPTVL